MCAPTQDCYMSFDLHMYITTSISKDETNDYRLLFHFSKFFQIIPICFGVMVPEIEDIYIAT